MASYVTNLRNLIYISIELGKGIPVSRLELPEYYRTCFCSVRYNNMDATFQADWIHYMRISGIESSSVMISQTKRSKWFKFDDNLKIIPKQVKAKSDGVINLYNYKFNRFSRLRIWILSKRYESNDVDRRTACD